MNAIPLCERAMLVTLNIRQWSASLTDKKVTAEVASNHAVNERRAGRYRKNLIDTKAPTYQAVGAAASELRKMHNFYTLPWSQDGTRILQANTFEQYSTTTRTLTADFDGAVRAFVDDYPRLKLAAKLELNGMYNESDYPTNIAAKFGVDNVPMPLPDAQDFRVNLSESAVAAIKGGIEAEMKKTLELAMREPYERLYTHISRMAARLSDKDGIFRDTLVSGLKELCTVLPGLNLASDPKLEELRVRAERMIANVDPQDLREIPSVRRDVARQAAEIQRMMAGYMGVPSKEAA
jgi:hypothetical protein